MVIFGGLEFVVGGYLIHRYHKSKNDKRRFEDEIEQRRHNTFPGAKPQSYSPISPQHSAIPPQKYAYYAPQPQPPPPPPPQCRPQPRPYASHPAPQSHSFMIPRRPVPQRQPQPELLITSLQRSDSMATISRMPIANGYRPSDIPEEDSPQSPRRQQPSLQPIPQQQLLSSPYSNAGFSVSTPAFTQTSMTPVTYTSSQPPRRNTVDDNWETYGPQSPHVHVAPPAHSHYGNDENDPPPPYQP